MRRLLLLLLVFASTTVSLCAVEPQFKMEVSDQLRIYNPSVLMPHNHAITNARQNSHANLEFKFKVHR